MELFFYLKLNTLNLKLRDSSRTNELPFFTGLMGLVGVRRRIEK